MSGEERTTLYGMELQKASLQGNIIRRRPAEIFHPRRAGGG